MVSIVSLGQGIQFLAPGISYHSPMLISLIPIDISGSNHLNSSISGWSIRISSPLFKRVGKLHQVLSNPLFRAYKKLEIFKADFRRTIWQFCRKSYWSQIENGGVHDVILCSHKPTTLVSHGALITGLPLFLGSIENMTLFANEQMS